MRLPAGLEKSQHGFLPLCSTDRVTSYYSSTDCSKKNVLQIVLHVSEINFNAAFSRPKEGSPRAPAERSSSGGVASERLARLGDVLAHGAVAFVVDDAVALRLPETKPNFGESAASRPRVVATSKSAGNLIERE